LYKKLFSDGKGKLNGDCNVMGTSPCHYVIDKRNKMEKKEKKIHEEINVTATVIRSLENRVRIKSRLEEIKFPLSLMRRPSSDLKLDIILFTQYDISIQLQPAELHEINY
jgi:hypothetical protein